MMSCERPDTKPSGIGLVLGAGGTTGTAFHAGTLLALHHDLGWDPNSADVIVGSSAGSIVGCLIRAGFAPDDLSAWGASVASSPSGRPSRGLLDAMESTRPGVRPTRPRLPVPSRAIVRRLLRPSDVRLHTVAMAMLPFGWIDAGAPLERIGDLMEGWPERPLWIPAVRVGDARRVVWGRDDIEVTPGRAIAASCAIPGLFSPVTIDGDRYIDGGAHSATNADLLLDAGVHTAIVLSPMSGHPGRRYRPGDLVRAAMSRQVRAECAALSNAGVSVHLFEPDTATLTAMGVNALSRTRTSQIVRDAFLAAGLQIVQDDSLRQLLDRRTPVPGGTSRIPA